VCACVCGVCMCECAHVCVVWLALYLEGGQVDGEAGSLGISSYSEHGALIPTGER